MKIAVSLRTAHRPTAEKIARLYRSCLDVLNADFLASMVDPQPEALPRPRKRALRLSRVLDAYLEEIEAQGRQAKTVKHYQTARRVLLAKLGEDVRAKALAGPKGVTLLRGYVAARRGEGILGRTIRQELRVLRAAWEHGQVLGLIPRRAVCPVIPAILPQAEPASETPIFTGSAELDELREACDDAEVVNFLLCARYTGMRPSEIGRIRWEDIDIEAGILRWENRKAGGAAGVAKVQVRALTAEAVAFFRGLGRRDAPGRLGMPFVTDVAFRQRWKRWRDDAEHAEERAKFRDIRYMPRSLRHRLNSLLLDAGLPTKRVQAFLGHASESMTHVRYAEAVRSAEELGGLTLAGS